MKSRRKNILTVILLLGLTLSLMNILSESGGKINTPMDDPNIIDGAKYQIGI